MRGDPKKLAGIIVAGMPAPDRLKRARSSGGGDGDAEDQGDGGNDEEGEDAAGVSAMGDLIDALRNKDAEGAWSAFCDAVEICGGRSYK